MANKIEIAQEHLNDAFYHFQEEEYDKCILECNLALEIIEKTKGDNNKLKEEIFYRLAEAHFYNGDYQKAIESYSESIFLLLTMGNNEEIIISRNIDIGFCFSWDEKLDDALRVHKQAAKDLKKLKGSDSDEYYQQTANVASAYYSLNDLDNAIEIYKSAINYRESKYEEDDYELNKYKNSLADCLYNNGSLNEAYQLYKTVYRFSNSENIENEVRLLSNIVDLAQKTKTTDDLSSYYESLVKNSIELNGENVEEAEIAFNAGKYFDTIKNYSEAEKYYKISFSIYEQQLGKSNSETLRVAQFLSIVYYQLSNYPEAEGLTKYLLEENGKIPNNDKNMQVLLRNMGFIYYYSNEYNKAEKYFKDSLQLSTSLFGEFDSRTISTTIKIADVYHWRDDYKLSISYLNSFLSKYLKTENPDKEIIANVNKKIAASFYSLPGNANDAIFHYNKALEIYKSIYGYKHEQTLDVIYELSRLYYARIKNYITAEEFLSLFLENAKDTLTTCDVRILRSELRLANLKLTQKNSIKESNKLVKSSLKRISEFVEERQNNVPKKIQKVRIELLHQQAEIRIRQSKIQRAIESIKLSAELCKTYCDKTDFRYEKQFELMSKLMNASEINDELNTSDGKETYLKLVKQKLDEPLSKNRVRIFISSTFRDMMDEREHLIKQVFPKLKTLCSKRGIDFSVVDLRWGVTVEDVEQGKVIEICLDEIDRSRPYFIGILGERYGWVPTSDSFSNYERIVNNYDWIKSDFEEGLSITEMEIQYGVLRNPAMKGNAFFYFRDEKLTPGEDEFREKIGSEYHGKLQKLKNTLTNNEEFPVKDFSSLEQLGEDIYNDLLNALFDESDFELTENTSEIKLSEQLDYIKLHTEFYIPSEEVDSKFADFITSSSNKLLVSGVHGSGKTAFLANTLLHFDKTLNNWLPIVNFIDAGSGSKDYNQILLQMVSQLNEVFPNTNEFYDSANPENILTDVFNSIPKQENVLFLIDGIEKLKQNEFFATLYWLPTEIPKNVKVVFSTCDVDFKNILEKRNFEIIELGNLEEKSQHDFINNYLLKFGKKLSPSIVNKIAESKLSDNPLSLKVLLDELRIFGSHEELESHLGYYLDATNSVELFNKLLTRFEKDYEEKNPGLVGKTITSILLSKKGLSEDELLEICDTAKLFWSPIFSALENYILQNNGLLSINNESLINVVKRRYLTSAELVEKIHANLANYFENCGDEKRQLEELAYHLCNSNNLEKLKNYTTQIGVFEKLYYQDPIEFLNYFNSLKANYNMVEEYKKSIANYETDLNYNSNVLANALSKLINLFRINQDSETSTWFAEKSYSIRTESFGENSIAQAESLLDLGKNCESNEDYENGIPYLKQAIEIFNQNPGYKPVKRALALNGLSNMYLGLKKPEEAEKYIYEAKEILENNMGEDNFAVSTCYHTIARIEQQKGNSDVAIENIDKALVIAKQFGGEEHISISWLMYLKADIYREVHGEDAYEYAMPLYMEAYKIQKNSLGVDSAQTLVTAISMASLLFEVEFFEEAKEFLEENLEYSKHALGPKHKLTQAFTQLLEYANKSIEKDSNTNET